MSIGFSDVAAVLALGLSGYATWKTIQFNKRQDAFMESQETLNRRLSQREDSEAKAGQQADLGATFVKLGSTSWRLKIWNKGKSPARHVSLEFVEGKEHFIESDVASKFPMEVLHPHQSVELIAAVGIGSPSKFQVSLRWEDDYQTHNQRTIYPTI